MAPATPRWLGVWRLEPFQPTYAEHREDACNKTETTIHSKTQCLRSSDCIPIGGMLRRTQQFLVGQNALDPRPTPALGTISELAPWRA